MPSNPRLRRLVALPAAGLVAALLTTTGPVAAPAVATPGCLSEAVTDQPVTGLGGEKCDDEVPPVVDPTVTVTPEPRTGQRWISSKRVTFAFSGRFTDADGDRLGFECQFYDSVNAPSSWEPCTSPVSFQDLQETGAVPYTFRARAVDLGDHAIDATATCGIGCSAPGTDREDVSAPVSTEVRVDTVAPSGAVRASGLFDEENPSWPMVRSKRLQVVLTAAGTRDRSPVAFDCTLNGAKVPCASGTTDLRRLTPGDNRFSARARDAAGNVDPTPATLQFSVPRNLTAKKGTGWKRVREGGYFANDFLQTSRRGAVVSFPARNVRELRLIAPSGPGLGKVEVKVGRGAWRTVNLAGKRYERFHVYQVRDQFEVLMSGRIQVRSKVASKQRLVRVDAVLAH